jgi:Transposase DDE domain
VPGQPAREDDGKGGPRGDDAHKKVNGRKRHLAVDTTGLLLRVVVHPASVQDRDGATVVLAALAAPGAFPRLRQLWADAAYAATARPRARTKQHRRQCPQLTSPWSRYVCLRLRRATTR